jgi:hypothetical protein
MISRLTAFAMRQFEELPVEEQDDMISVLDRVGDGLKEESALRSLTVR